MRINFQLGVPVLALALTVLSGCVATPNEKAQQAEQKQALSRWNDCIERHLPEESKSVSQFQTGLEQACDGHKRDVLMTYPQRMEKELDAYLVYKTRERVIKHLSYQSAGLSSAEVDAALFQAAVQ